MLYLYLISVLLYNTLYFIKRWFTVTNFTLPRLFRNPGISTFFAFPEGLGNSGVRLYVYSCFDKACRNAKVHAAIPKGNQGNDQLVSSLWSCLTNFLLYLQTYVYGVWWNFLTFTWNVGVKESLNLLFPKVPFGLVACSSTSLASRRSKLGTDYVLAINTHICRSVVPGRSAAYVNQ